MTVPVKGRILRDVRAEELEHLVVRPSWTPLNRERHLFAFGIPVKLDRRDGFWYSVVAGDCLNRFGRVFLPNSIVVARFCLSVVVFVHFTWAFRVFVASFLG